MPSTIEVRDGFRRYALLRHGEALAGRALSPGEGARVVGSWLASSPNAARALVELYPGPLVGPAATANLAGRLRRDVERGVLTLVEPAEAIAAHDAFARARVTAPPDLRPGFVPAPRRTQPTRRERPSSIPEESTDTPGPVESLAAATPVLPSVVAPPFSTDIEALATLLNEARAAQARAEDHASRLPPKFRRKTVACDGATTLSGFKADEDLPAGFTRSPEMSSEQLLTYSRQLEARGYTPTLSGAADKGVPGANAATHAEKQLERYHAVVESGKPIGVSRSQCGDCRTWFQAVAQHEQRDIVVADPEFTRVFRSDGSVGVYDGENQLVASVEPQTPPSASIVSYEGVPW